MNIHKRTRRSTLGVSRPTIDDVLKHARRQEFTPRDKYQSSVQNVTVRPQALS
ncbi:MAG: hypothetical protein WAU15_02315 [Nitrosomonas sp.]